MRLPVPCCGYEGGGEAGKEREQRQKLTVLPTVVTGGHCGCIHTARRLRPSTKRCGRGSKKMDVLFFPKNIPLVASVILRILDNNRVVSETLSGTVKNGIKRDV